MGGVFWFGMSLFTRQAWIWNEKSQIGSTSLSHLEARFPAQAFWSETDDAPQEALVRNRSIVSRANP